MNREEFDRFYETHISFVFQIAYRLLKNRAEAEDVCHDIFLDMLQRPNLFDPARGSIKAWLAVTTRNRCYDRLRKKQPLIMEDWEKNLSERPWQPSTTVEENVLSNAEKEMLHQALSNIPQAQREALYGTYFRERTQRELATEMKRPLGTIKSLVRYGLNNLKKQKALLHWIKSGGGGQKHDPEM